MAAFQPVSWQLGRNEVQLVLLLVQLLLLPLLPLALQLQSSQGTPGYEIDSDSQARDAFC